LAGARAGAPTALIIPVPECSVVVTPPGDMPHHVTVIYPFVGQRHVNARLIARLTEAFASHPAFDFELTSVGRFPDVLYLGPEPVEPFRRLVDECTRQWPSHPPYGGRFPEVIPHLTLASGPEPAGLAERVTSRLPIRAQATEVWLMERTRPEGWRRVVRLPLSDVGSNSAPDSST
jgi:2'-5' RNA ligase